MPTRTIRFIVRAVIRSCTNVNSLHVINEAVKQLHIYTLVQFSKNPFHWYNDSGGYTLDSSIVIIILHCCPCNAPQDLVRDHFTWESCRCHYMIKPFPTITAWRAHFCRSLTVICIHMFWLNISKSERLIQCSYTSMSDK